MIIHADTVEVPPVTNLSPLEVVLAIIANFVIIISDASFCRILINSRDPYRNSLLTGEILDHRDLNDI